MTKAELSSEDQKPVIFSREENNIKTDSCELPENISEIMAQFESIGDNCEFGLVQRHFGAEPVTLFRFSVLPPLKMIELLELRLEPLGDPAHTVIFEEGNEYIVKDDRGYYWMHSFIRKGHVDPERYLKQQGARIQLLKRKFLRDLQDGNHIYVCKQSDAPISDDILRRLSKSLRAYGNNLLLGIRRADANHPAGAVEQFEDHILIAYMKTLFAEGDAGADHASWETVVRSAHKMKMDMVSAYTAT